jgi:hypothetical protein
MSDQPKQSLYGESDALSWEQALPMRFVELFSGVFSEPVELFKRLSKQPQWVGAMVLLTAITVVFSLVYALKVDALEFVAMQFERNPPPVTLSGAELDRAIEAGAKALPFFSVVGSLFSTPIIIFASGLIFWTIGLFSKEDAQHRPTYFHGLVVASVPALVTVPYYILGTAMAFLNSVGTLRPDQIIPSTLAYWLATDNPKLSMLYGSIDLFLIAQYVILFFAAKYTMRTKTWGAVLCVAISLLMVGVKIYFAK